MAPLGLLSSISTKLDEYDDHVLRRVMLLLTVPSLVQDCEIFENMNYCGSKIDKFGFEHSWCIQTFKPMS